MRRILTLTVLTVLLGLAVPATASGAASDGPTWTDRATIDVTFPTGWRIRACEGDAPYLCAEDPSGEVDGTVLLGVSDLRAGADTSAAGVRATVASFHDTIEDDRLITCPSHRFEREGPVAATVGGQPGYRFGFTLRDEQDRVAERAVIHLTFATGREFAVNTSFIDPEGCPGRDPDRIEFTVADMPQVLPHLDQLVAAIAVPSDFGAGGPACPPGKVPGATFSDLAGNPHRPLIDCTAFLGIARGTADRRFLPTESMTRAHAAAFIGRMLLAMGHELPMPPPNRFRDLAGHPQARIVNQLAAAGVIRGTSATTFHPGRAVTRAEAATLVVRAYELTLGQAMFDQGVAFDDVDGAHAATISRAATNGLVHGRDGGRFDPGTPVRRDEMAAIVGRAANRISWTRTVLPTGAG